VFLALPPALLLPRLAMAQDPPLLRPGERIPFPRLTITVLGLTVQQGANSTTVRLNLRGQTGENDSASVGSDNFRVLAADVPRAPEHVSVSIARDAAEDFTVTFNLRDRTPDLVLRMRFYGGTELRRLPTG
jgi:hypothetical protein